MIEPIRLDRPQLSHHFSKLDRHKPEGRSDIGTVSADRWLSSSQWQSINQTRPDLGGSIRDIVHYVLQALTSKSSSLSDLGATIHSLLEALASQTGYLDYQFILELVQYMLSLVTADSSIIHLEKHDLELLIQTKPIEKQQPILDLINEFEDVVEDAQVQDYIKKEFPKLLSKILAPEIGLRSQIVSTTKPVFTMKSTAKAHLADDDILVFSGDGVDAAIFEIDALPYLSTLLFVDDQLVGFINVSAIGPVVSMLSLDKVAQQPPQLAPTLAKLAIVTDESAAVSSKDAIRAIAHTVPVHASVEELEAVYKQLLADGIEDIFSIHIKASVSPAVVHAKEAAQRVKPSAIHVVDANTYSLGLGLLVSTIAKDILAKKTKVEVEAKLASYVKHECHWVYMPPKRAVLYIKHDPQVLGRYKSDSHAFAHLIASIERKIKKKKANFHKLGIEHHHMPGYAVELKKVLKKRLNIAHISIHHAGPYTQERYGKSFIGVSII